MTLNHPLLLIYDSDCGCCQKAAYLVEAWSNGRITVIARQETSQQCNNQPR